MSTAEETGSSGAGTLKAPKFHAGFERSGEDMHLLSKVIIFETSAGVVGGYEIAVTLTIDEPAAVVWPQFKDWDRWQNHSHKYSGDVGGLYSNEQLDLGAETFRIASKVGPGLHGKLGGETRDGKYETDDYVVLRVIPEHLLVIFQPVPAGAGAVSPGFHTFILHERDGRTTITGHMEHAKLDDEDRSEEELAEFWRNVSGVVVKFWDEIYIPQLRQCVAERRL